MGKSKKKSKQRSYNKSQGVNRHHLINKTRGGTDKEENIRVTKVRLHSCLHELFGNATPVETLECLIDYFNNVFTEEFRADLLEVLSAHRGNEHNPKCYKGNKIKGGGIDPLLHNEKINGGNEENMI